LLIPFIGKRPITHISAPELLETLRRIEDRGHNESARRAKQRASQIFRYAIATGRAKHDIAVNLRGAMAPVVTKSHAAITDPARVGALLRAVHGYSGWGPVKYALKLAPLVFVRPGELRAAEWSEIDLDDRLWRIEARRMKMREPHLVPLSKQAIAILKDLNEETGGDSFLFPSSRTPDRPMSDMAINAALRSLGYEHEEMTAHGFRATASTRLNELGWAPDLIELQLAHSDKDKVRAVYNRAERLEERREMMQSWANYLDSLRISAAKARNPTRLLGRDRADLPGSAESAERAATNSGRRFG
jgi:integrase